MADWVSKTDLIAHLDECIAESDGQTPIVDSVLMAIKRAVEQMPTVDGVPVVRCEECQYCLPYNNINYCSYYPYKECYVVISENGYCNYGKRRSDGGGE